MQDRGMQVVEGRLGQDWLVPKLLDVRKALALLSNLTTLAGCRP